MLEWTWRKAMTLAERARLYASALADSPAIKPPTERARKRLAKWKAQPPFDSDNLFAQRLRQIGLTESRLLDLLDQTTGPLPDSQLEMPAWAAEIINAFANSGKSEFSFDVAAWPDQPQYQFLQLIRPLIGRSVNRLREGIRSLPQLTAVALPEPEALEEILVRLLPGHLLSIVLRTMVLELNVAR